MPRPALCATPSHPKPTHTNRTTHLRLPSQQRAPPEGLLYTTQVRVSWCVPGARRSPAATPLWNSGQAVCSANAPPPARRHAGRGGAGARGGGEGSIAASAHLPTAELHAPAGRERMRRAGQRGCAQGRLSGAGGGTPRTRSGRRPREVQVDHCVVLLRQASGCGAGEVTTVSRQRTLGPSPRAEGCDAHRRSTDTSKGLDTRSGAGAV